MELAPGELDAYYQAKRAFPGEDIAAGMLAADYGLLLRRLRLGMDVEVALPQPRAQRRCIGGAMLETLIPGSAPLRAGYAVAAAALGGPSAGPLPGVSLALAGAPQASTADACVPPPQVAAHPLLPLPAPDSLLPAARPLPAAVQSLVVAALAPGAPRAVRGRPVNLDTCAVPTRGQPYARLQVSCRAPGHVNCFRHRNLTFQYDQGPLGVLGYLSAWLDQASAPGVHDRVTHMSLVVTKEQAVAAIPTL